MFEKVTRKKATLRRKQNYEDRNEKNRIKFENAINFCNDGEAPTTKQLAEFLDLEPRTVRNWVKKYGYKIDESGNVIKIQQPKE